MDTVAAATAVDDALDRQLQRDADRGVRFDTDQRRAHRAVLLAREEGVRKSDRNEKLVAIFRAQRHCDLLTEGRRAFSQVDDHIEEPIDSTFSASIFTVQLPS